MCRATIKSHGMQSIQTIFAESIELLGKVIGTRDGILHKIQQVSKGGEVEARGRTRKGKAARAKQALVPDGTTFKTESTGSHGEVFPGRPSSQKALGPTQYRATKILPATSFCEPGSDSKHAPKRFCSG